MDFTLDDEVAFRHVEEGLRHYLGQCRGWFTGGSVTINVGLRIRSLEELGRLRQVLEDEFQLKVARFWCGAEALEKAFSEESGVPVALMPPQRPSPLVGEALRPRDQPLYIKSTCRSGTTINYHGDVIVLGDVNPGAEVTATGDVIVLGTLRGVAHAGASNVDSTEAVIIALSLRPLQLRIGCHVFIPPADKGNHVASSNPEFAHVKGRSIIIAPFSGRLPATVGT